MPCCPQHLLEWWVFGCLLVGWLLFLGGARAPGAALLALHRTQGHEQVLALRGVMLPGVRGPLAPGAACVQRRFPRAAVPGAGVAGDAVIAEARTGDHPGVRGCGPDAVPIPGATAW